MAKNVNTETMDIDECDEDMDMNDNIQPPPLIKPPPKSKYIKKSSSKYLYTWKDIKRDKKIKESEKIKKKSRKKRGFISKITSNKLSRHIPISLTLFGKKKSIINDEINYKINTTLKPLTKSNLMKFNKKQKNYKTFSINNSSIYSSWNEI